MQINKIWILPATAVAVGAIMLSWMNGSGQPAKQQFQDLGQPDTQQTNAAGSRTDIKRVGRDAVTAEPVDTSDKLILRKKPRQLPASRGGGSLVDMERRLLSNTTDDLQAILWATQKLKTLQPVPAGQTRNTPSSVSRHPQATHGLSDSSQDTVATTLDSTGSSAMRTHDNTTSRAAAFPAHDMVNAATHGSTPPGQPNTPTSTAIAANNPGPVIEQPPTTTTDNKGPWVINLISVSSKSDADRMTEKALSMGIQTEQQKVTVKGKPYWRIQVTGFATAEDARNHTETAKEILGLKSVWIMKR